MIMPRGGPFGTCLGCGLNSPEKAAFKPQLARRMLERALESGVPFGWVTGDEVYGNDRAAVAGNCQSQAGALVGGLGGEEGIRQARGVGLLRLLRPG